jgi:hypothetical protein
MKKVLIMAALVLGLTAVMASSAQAGVAIGVGWGHGGWRGGVVYHGFYPRPYYAPRVVYAVPAPAYYYYPPAPVYVAPPPAPAYPYYYYPGYCR